MFPPKIKKEKKIMNFITLAKFYAQQSALAMAGAPNVLYAGGGGQGGDPLAQVDGPMKQVLNILLTIMRYAGFAMVIYGVYEIIMSVQNNQPEAKTKGIIMALSGVVMISMKSVVNAFGLNL